MLSLKDAITARHSVRRYIHKPLPQDVVDTLQSSIEECNRLGNLHIQLVVNETKAFSGLFAYGSFSGVENYLVMAGSRSKDLDQRIGYYGEQLVLLAQQLGLNTCWAGLSYRTVQGAYNLEKGEKIACMIALGYGETQGHTHKIKTQDEVIRGSSNAPSWFFEGIRAALLAPTAVNQQKFSFEYIPPSADGIHRVKARRGFSTIGYTSMDLGIATLHFEIGAGIENFQWI